jgi:hypothetical protein
MMAKPNSWLTRIRRKLADKLDPMPDKGEGWCVGCSLNNGRTIVTNADGLENHVGLHPDREYVKVVANW